MAEHFTVVDHRSTTDAERISRDALSRSTVDATSRLLLDALDSYLRSNPVGYAFGGEAIYRPDLPHRNRTAWRPSASVVASGRLAGGRFPLQGLHGRPALAFVSITPGMKANDLERALLEYVAAGVPLIWVAYPVLRFGRVVRPGEPFVAVPEQGGVFDGGDVLPGLRVPLADVLPPADLMPGDAASDD